MYFERHDKRGRIKKCRLRFTFHYLGRPQNYYYLAIPWGGLLTPLNCFSSIVFSFFVFRSQHYGYKQQKLIVQ